MYVRLLRTGNESSFVDEVRRFDRVFAEAEVRYGNTAGFLGVIGKVSLSVHIRVVTDNLNSALVGADRAVGAKAPELASRRAFRRRVDVFAEGQGRVGNVVDDADSELIFRLVELQVFEYGKNVGRSRVFSAEASAAAYDKRLFFLAGIYALDVEVQRFSNGARFFRAVKNSDLRNRFRNIFEEVFFRERAIEVNCQESDFFTAFVEEVYRFFDSIRQGTHSDNHAVCVGSAVVSEGMVFPARESGNFFHVVFNDIRQRFVVLVLYFLLLEVDIRVLQRALRRRMIRVGSAVAEFFNSVHVD